ncbi:MAG: CoA pyrophosphatase [Tissierellia bacterium]|nr:CoA pyrophosphatase [Tissierellia bacterium]
MDLKKIDQRLRGRRPRPMGIESLFSVMITLIPIEGEWHLIFERRANSLRSQPNEVSLPGGHIDKGETPRQTAKRECMEELRLEEDQVEVLYELDYVVSRKNQVVHCFLGQVKDREIYTIRPNPDEVSYIFTVPLSYFMENEPRQYSLTYKSQYSEDFPYELIPGGEDYPFREGKETIHFYIYEDRVIWGLTAKMVYAFTQILKGKA